MFPSPVPCGAGKAGAELSPLSLWFTNPEEEARYRAAQAHADLRMTRIALAVAAAANAVFALVDQWALPQGNVPMMLALRFGVMTPGILLAFGLTYVDFLLARRQLLLGVLMLGFTATYGAILTPLDAPLLYIGGFAFVVLAIYTALPFDFVSGTATAWLSTALFAAIVVASAGLASALLVILAGELLAANIVGAVALYRTERFRRLAYVRLEALAAERSNVHELLVRILPRSVAERLTMGESRVVDHMPDSTVLFADLVGFTRIAAETPPEQTLEFLNQVFSAIDRMVDHHGLEKIKTIGDAYMVAGGLTNSGHDHAEVIADLALDMLATVGKLRAPDGSPVQLRIGVHAGPLVAGVIGESRFHYDLWGDTVNIASRMEAMSEPGRIQVTEAIYRRLRDRFEFVPRGEFEVKGKGRLAAWYLICRKPTGPDRRA